MAILTAAFKRVLEEQSKRIGSIIPKNFNLTVDALTFIFENRDLVCRSCGCLGVLTYSENPGDIHLPGWTAHIECPNSDHSHNSEGYAQYQTQAIRNAKIHWNKYS